MFPIMKRFSHHLHRFLKSDRGMTLPLLALAMVFITGMTGMGIDIARMQLLQSKLQFSLDSAGLAAGSTASTTQIQSEVNKFLTANFNGYMGATVSNLSITTTDNNLIINLNATASMPTTFMNVLGIKTITISASSQISRATNGLELVLVLDNTGSMANDNKLASLKTASNTLVTTLNNNKSPGSSLYIGLVPFSQAVNTTTGYPSWMDTAYDATLVWPTNQPWAGCVQARVQNGLDITDDPPNTNNVSTLFREYYNPCPTGQMWNANGSSCISDCTNGFTWSNSSNSCVCGTGKQIVNGACVSNCTNGFTWSNSQQACVCPSGTYQSGNSCLNYCSGDLNWNGSSCVCPTGQHVSSGTNCVNNCINGFQWQNSTSSCVCPSSSYISGASCIPHCSSPYTWNGTSCVPPTCQTGYTWNGTACVKNGPS